MKTLLTRISSILKPAAGRATTQEEKIQSVVDQTVDNKLVYGTVVGMLKDDAVTTYSAGNISDTTSYFIASTTKLYTNAITMKLRSMGALALEDPIAKYLPPEVIEGLHVYKGVDYTEKITIQHLLAQTSGLPDYFEGKRKGEPSLLDELFAGKDQYVSFEDVVAVCKSNKPKFPPGKKGKAFYSDSNWRILQQVLENITSASIVELFEVYIFKPLGLKKTYAFTDINDKAPIDIYYKKENLHWPKAMTSFQSDGGIVSTAEESLLFLKAFYSGALFPKSYLAEMKDWNNVFYPIRYGTGMMRLRLPKFMTGGKNFDLIGHAGVSGAFAFYDEERDLYIAGTVNQMHKRGTSFKLMLKVIAQLN